MISINFKIKENQILLKKWSKKVKVHKIYYIKIILMVKMTKCAHSQPVSKEISELREELQKSLKK